METTRRWMLGMAYVVAVAAIWITASYVVQSIVGAGVSPFLLSYICNSLFVVYLPIVEGGRWLTQRLRPRSSVAEEEAVHLLEGESSRGSFNSSRVWRRREVAQASLLICPFWFLAQFTFNLSLRYTSVTSNTILSSTSSLFTFLLSLAILNESFTWTKLVSVILCMAGTATVTLADSGDAYKGAGWGDVLCVFSAMVYALYSTLLRKRLPDEAAGEGTASTALFFGYLGLFNFLLLGPVALVLHFTGLDNFRKLSVSQLGLIVAKGLLDNVLSDYLWAKAVLLTTPTAATAGLTIQVPMAGMVDSVRGKVPSPMHLLGAAAILLGFFGINEPATGCFGSSSEDDGDMKENADGSTVLR